jgi:hypothetical protein
VDVDHVLLAGDATQTSPVLPAPLDLEAYEGGRHPGWGTANSIIPLGDSYLELVTIVDEVEARASSFGRWVLESAERPGAAIGWAVRPYDIDATAIRLGLEISERSRVRASGDVVAWRSAGMDEASRRPWLPFFIEWRDASMLPGRVSSSGARPERVELECDVNELDRWLGAHSLPLDVRAGEAGVVAVAVQTPAGRVVLGRV